MEDHWDKFNRICGDHDYTKCLECGRNGTFFEHVEMLKLISSVPSTYQTKEAKCTYCKAPKPWLDWRSYGLSTKQIREGERSVYPESMEPWSRPPLWTLKK